jgi:hypothetical protein
MAKERTRARHEQETSQRAEHKRKKRRAALIKRGVGGALLVAVAGAAGFCVINERALMQAVTTATYPGGLHAAGKLTYGETPPLGGTHNVVWQNCGIYKAPIHNEHAVHSMEHGAVWITYRPDLPADQVQQLEALAADDYMLLSPYPGLTAPVVASAWNHQITLEGAGDPRLPRFIARFKNNASTTPEFGAVCFGGTSSAAASKPIN